MAAVITRTRDGVSCLGVAKAAPQIPHTLFFYLRRREKGSAGTGHVAAETKTGHTQIMIGVPGKQEASNKQRDKKQGGNEKEKERFALQQQTPVKIFIPRGVNPSQEVAQAQTIERQPRETDVRKLLIVIDREIAGDAAGSLREYGGILQILAGKRMTLRIAQDSPICGIYDDPAAVHHDFGDHMLGTVFRSE